MDARYDYLDLGGTPAQKEIANQLKFSRINAYAQSKDWWVKYPAGFGQHISSGVTEKTHDILGIHAPAIDAYIGKQNQFAGVDHAFTHLQRTALKIADPTQRAQAQQVVDTLKGLDPATQTAFYTWLNNPGAFQTTETTQQRGGAAETSATTSGQSEATAAIGSLLPHATVDENGNITVSSDYVTTDQVAEMYRLFPQLQGKIHFSEGGVSLNDVQDSFAQASQPFLAPIVGHDNFGSWQLKKDDNGNPIGDPEDPKNWEFVESTSWNPQALANPDQIHINPLSLAETGLTTFGYGFSHGVGAVFGAAGYLTAGRGTTARNMENYIFGGAARLFERGMDDAATGIGNVMLTPITWATGHKFDHATTQFWGSLGLIVVLHGITEGLGTAKTTMSAPAEFTSGELGVADGWKAGLNTTLENAAKASNIGGKGADTTMARIAAIAEHPLHMLMDPTIRQLVFDGIQKIRGTSMEDWVNQSSALKFFDKVSKIVNENPDKATAALKQAFPGLPDEYLNRLADVASRPDLMPSVTLDYADEAAGKVETAADYGMKAARMAAKEAASARTEYDRMMAEAAARTERLVALRTGATQGRNYFVEGTTPDLVNSVVREGYVTGTQQAALGQEANDLMNNGHLPDALPSDLKATYDAAIDTGEEAMKTESDYWDKNDKYIRAKHANETASEVSVDPRSPLNAELMAAKAARDLALEKMRAAQETEMQARTKFQQDYVQWKASQAKLGEPLRVLHGTDASFQEFTNEARNPNSLYGPGHYFTQDVIEHTGTADITSGYAGVLQEEFQTFGEAQLEFDNRVNQFGEDHVRLVEDSKGKWRVVVDKNSTAGTKVVVGQEAVDSFVEQLKKRGIPEEDIKVKAHGTNVTDRVTGKTDEFFTIDYKKAVSPNVHFAHLDITNPFDIDKKFSAAEVDDLAQRYEDAGYSAAAFKDMLEGLANPDTGVIGNTIYDALVELFDGDKTAVNETLQSMGYDGITHEGGQITNQPHGHQVWIAFDESQVYQGVPRPSLEETLSAADHEAMLKGGSSAVQAKIDELRLGPGATADAAEQAVAAKQIALLDRLKKILADKGINYQAELNAGKTPTEMVEQLKRTEVGPDGKSRIFIDENYHEAQDIIQEREASLGELNQAVRDEIDRQLKIRELEGIKKTIDTANKVDDINVDRRVAEQAAYEAALRPPPIDHFPNANAMPDFLHRVFYRPTTLAERVFRNILNPRNWVARAAANALEALGKDGDWLTRPKQPFLTKLTDKLENDASIRFDDPTLSTAERYKIQQNNNTVMGRLLLKAGVPSDEAAAIMQKVMDAHDWPTFYDVVTKELFGQDGVLAHHIEANFPDMPDSFKNKILSTGQGDSLAYQHGVSVTDSNGVTHNEPVLYEVRGGVEHTLPSAPSEFPDRVRLPSGSSIEDAFSRAKRAAENMRTASGKGPQAAGWAYSMGQAVMKVQTVGLKIPALMFNLPAIIFTKLLDETLGNANSPNMGRVFRAAPGAGDFVIDPSIVGQTLKGTFDLGSEGSRLVPGEVSTRQILSKGGLETEPTLIPTIIERMNKIHDDPMLSAFARTGLDLDKMRELVTGGDEGLTRFFDTHVAPQLAKTGTSMDEWLGRWADSIREATFDHPDYLKYVADGYVGGQGAGIIHNGEEVSAQYTRLNKEAATIRDELAKLDPLSSEDIPQIRAAQTILKEKLEAINHLEELAAQSEDARVSQIENTIGRSNKVTKYNQATGERVTRYSPRLLGEDIRARIENNEITLPDRMRISRVATSRWGGVSTLPDMATDVANRVAEYLYSREGRLSFENIGKAEARFARGSFYAQRAEQFYRGFREMGLEPENAKALASFKAAEMTKDFFYDLTAKSTVERQLRNWFWFAPVNAELLYRWLYAIPAQSGGWLPGATMLAAKAYNWEHVLTNLGIVHTDPVTGEDVIPIPGLANVIKFLSGGKIDMQDILQIPLKSLNPHLSGPIPTLSPVPASALNSLTQDIPVLNDLAKVIAPYGDVTFVPYSIRNLASIMGIKIPDVSNDYVNQQWDRTHDLALQYAYVDLQQHGQPQPQLADYAKDPNLPTDEETAAYMKDWNIWFDALNGKAASFARGIYFKSLLSGAIFPGSIEGTTKEEQDYKVFFQTKILPQIQLSQTGMPQATRDKLNEWLRVHPDSQAFAISYNYYTGKTLPKPVSGSDEAYYRSLYTDGIKATMAPEDYAQVLAAMNSSALYQARQKAAIDQIAPTGNWADVINNWYTRSQAVATNQIQWKNYLAAHPEADAILKKNNAAMYKQYGIPTKSIEATYVSDALLSMKALSGFFTGEDGLPDSEYSGALSQIKALNAQLYKDTGGQLTPMEKGISWYFDNVLTPYMDETKPLYDQAGELSAKGLDASAIYSQIDAVKQKYVGMSYEGQVAPSPDEFFYNNKSPLAQQYAKTHWITQPRAWLSDFQRSTVGYQSFPGEDEMWAQAETIRQQASASIDAGGYTPGSTSYQKLTKWRDNQLYALAQQYGTAGQQAMANDLAAPYVRLQQTSFGSDNANMQNIYAAAQQATNSMLAAGVSPQGYSQTAADLKYWFYSQLANAENSDPGFKALMEKLSFSMKADANGNHPTGVPLYEAIFFGNFNPAYIPQSFIQDAPTGAI